MKVNQKTILIIALCLFFMVFSSCGLLKSVSKKESKKESQKDLTEQIITKTTRIGDTVHYSIPAVRFRDTTIYTYNRQGTRLSVRYDDRGQIDLAECIASAVAEMKEENRRFLESQKEELKEKEKEETVDTNINWTWIVLGVFGIIGIIVFKKL